MLRSAGGTCGGPGAGCGRSRIWRSARRAALDTGGAILQGQPPGLFLGGRASARSAEEVGEAVELCEASLKETRKDPIKSPKHFKYAEIKTVDLLRKIEAFSQDMNVDDRAMLEKLKERVQAAHDRLLQGIMMGKKK